MSSLATFSSIQLNKLRQQQDPSADAVIATYAPHALKEMHEVLGALKTNADLLPAETKVPLQLLYQDIIKQHTLIEKAVWDNGFHFSVVMPQTLCCSLVFVFAILLCSSQWGRGIGAVKAYHGRP